MQAKAAAQRSGWLEWLVPAAPAEALLPGPAISARRAYLEVAVVYLATFATAVWTAFHLLGEGSHRLFPSEVSGRHELTRIGIAWALNLPGVVLALWLSWRRGMDPRRLGFAPAWARGRRWQAVRIFAVLWFGQVVAALLLLLLAPHSGIAKASGAWAQVGAISAALRSGLAEEVVVSAFLITTLRQARRPAPEILGVALAARVAYHVYYGTWWVILWVVVWAGTFFVVYWWTRRLTVLVVTHALWDLQPVAFAIGGSVVAGVLGLAYLVLFLAAGIVALLWLLSLLPARDRASVTDPPAPG